MKDRLKNAKWIIFVCLSILFLSVIIFRKNVIEGYFLCTKGLWSDLLRTNLPTYYQLYDSLSEGWNYWSWRMGIGTSMFSHADVYFDPFTYILFIFGRKYIPNMMIWMLIVKLIFEGISFFIYLDYFKLDRRASLLAAVIYAFSGYSLVMGNNLAFGTILVYAPIVFLGVEKWLDTGRVRLLVFSLFLTCIYYYYFFFILGLLLVLYVCVRQRQRNENPLPKVAVLAGIGTLVIILSMFTLVPQLQLTFSSARMHGAKDYSLGLGMFIPQLKVLATAVIRSISNDLLGNPITGQYMGYAFYHNHDYFQISCYTTPFLFILALQYWKYEKHNRKKLLAVIGIAVILILFPVFSYISNAFATINARWMFIITMLECILAGVSIDSVLKHGGLHGKSLMAGILASIAAVLCGIVFLSLGTVDFYSQFASYIYKGRRFFAVLLVEYVILAVIYALQRSAQNKMHRIGIYFLIVLVLILDEGVNYFHVYGMKQSVNAYTEEERACYEDTSAEMIHQIQKEDESFYRINKDFDSVVDWNQIPSQNDAMAQGYYGLKNYNSLDNAEYIEFLQTLGIYVACPPSIPYYVENMIAPKDVRGVDLNYINGVGDRYHLMSYLGVKYFMSQEQELILPGSFRFVKRVNNISLYENRNCYPLAFINEKLMSLQQFEKLSDQEKDAALLEYTIVDGEGSLKAKLTKNQKGIQRLAEDKQNAFRLIHFSPDRVEFEIDAPENARYLSFSIPYTDDWHVYIDGKEARTCKVNVSLLGAGVQAGMHNVEIRYDPSGFRFGLILSGAGLLLLLLLWKSAGTVIVCVEHTVETAFSAAIEITRNEKIRIYAASLTEAAGFLIVSFAIAAVSIYVLFPSLCLKKQLGIQHYALMSIFAAFSLGALLYIRQRARLVMVGKKSAVFIRADRESNLELCRIVCMLLIIAHHCVLHGGAFEMEGMSGNRIFALFLIPGGKLCFDCFLAISSWHLVDQKFSAKRFLRIWAQVLFYSVAFALIAFMCGIPFRAADWFSVFLPITGNSHGFAAAYLAFYLLLPFLNLLSERLDKKQARWLLILLLYFETGSQIIGVFTSYTQRLSSELLLFVLFYVIALNLKKWPVKICENKKLMFGIFAFIWVGLWMVRFLYVQNPEHAVFRFLMDTMCDESSITNIVGGTAFFFFFKNLKVKKNLMMNDLAMGTFGILLMHDHNFFRHVLWQQVLHTQDWYYASWFWMAVGAVVIWVYAAGFFIERVRALTGGGWRKYRHRSAAEDSKLENI